MGILAMIGAMLWLFRKNGTSGYSLGLFRSHADSGAGFIPITSSGTHPSRIIAILSIIGIIA